jgi:hypothetical protein
MLVSAVREIFLKSQEQIKSKAGPLDFFGAFKPKKLKGPMKPKKSKAPRKSRGSGSASYKFLPIPKSQEERDLMAAKARALNARINQLDC